MMKNTKAALAIACLAVAGVALQGCAGASESSSGESSSDAGAVDGAGKTLKVSYGVNNLYPQEQNQWFSDISEKFKEKTGATLEFETWATPNDELTKIQTSVLSGQGPDVYAIGTTFTPTAYATGAFVKLTATDWDKVGGRDRFVPATLGISGPDENSQVGIPFVSRPFVMAYNTKLLKAAGIDKPADSWDGLREQAKQLTSGDVHGISTGYADAFDSWKLIWAMSMQGGNPLVKDGKASIDDPITVNAYETYYGWLTDGSVDPAAVGWKNSQALANFAEGKAAFMLITSANSMKTLDSSAVAGSYAYTVMPTIPPGETSLPKDGVAAAGILSGDNLVVADYSPNKELAFAYAELVTNPEEQKHYYEVFGELPANAEAADALQTDNESLAPLVEAGGKSVATPFTGAWSEIQLALSNVTVQTIPALANGSASATDIEARVQEAQVAAQSALDRVK